MFLICTQDSVKLLTKEMLLYFKENEPQLKEDIALKVAILAEKYATDFKWYIESIVKMIELAGEYVSEDIIFRFFQLMKGFENQPQDELIQIYAVEKIIKLLEKDFINENAIKLGALIFGEFGHLVQNAEYEKYVSLLKKHMTTSGNNTITQILTAFMKLIRSSNGQISYLIIPILEEYLESWDTELQQRAVEYMVICNSENKETILDTVFNQMPLYNQEILNNSILMKRLSKTNKTLYSKTKEGKEEKKIDSPVKVSEARGSTYNINPTKDESKLEKLLTVKYDENHPFAEHYIFQKNQSAFTPQINRIADYAEGININSVPNYPQFKSFITNINNAGLIYDNAPIRIDLKLKSLNVGTLGAMLTFTSDSGLSDLELINLYTPEGLEIQTSKFKALDPNNSQVLIKIKLLNSFSQPLSFRLNGNFGFGNNSIEFCLPVLINKFIDTLDIKIEDYSYLWLEYSNTVSEETQRLDTIMKNPLDGQKTVMEFLKKLGGLLNSMGFRVFPPNDINSYHEIEACGVLPAGENLNFPVLLQAAFIPSYTSEFRFSIRVQNQPTSDFYRNLSLDLYSIVKMFINPK